MKTKTLSDVLKKTRQSIMIAELEWSLLAAETLSGKGFTWMKEIADADKMILEHLRKNKI